jgi:ribosomal protein L7/L12
MATKRKPAKKPAVTKKDLEKALTAEKCRANQATHTCNQHVQQIEGLVELNDDKKRTIQRLDTELATWERRVKAAANLLKSTKVATPATQEMMRQIAIGLLENRSLVDVAEELAADVDPVTEVVLDRAGGEKIKVIKELRNLFNLGLKDSKDLTDRAPVTIARVPESRAKEIKQALEASGAIVVFK